MFKALAEARALNSQVKLDLAAALQLNKYIS